MQNIDYTSELGVATVERMRLVLVDGTEMCQHANELVEIDLLLVVITEQKQTHVIHVKLL